MDEHRLKAWKDVARVVDAAARPATSGTDHSGILSRITRMAGRDPATFAARWTAAASRLAMSGRPWSPAGGHVGSTFDAPDKAGEATALRVIRLAHAVATSDADAVPTIDRGWLAQVLAADRRTAKGHAPFLAELRDLVDRDHRTEPVPRPDDEMPTTVTFAFPYDERRGGGFAVVRGEATASLRRADADDCPVVARLQGGAAGEVVLRDVGGELHRPLFRPGCWNPVGVAEFVALVGSGEAWADNPFMQRRHRDRTLADLDEHASPPRRGTDPGGLRAAALAAAMSRAGTLTVIDGVVHRPVGTPRLRLAGQPTEASGIGRGTEPRACKLEVTWTLDCGLASDDAQGTFPADDTHWVWHDQGLVRGLWLGHAGDVTPACLAFGLGDLTQVRELARRLNAGPVLRYFGGVFHLNREPSMEIDPARFPEDPLAALRAAASLGFEVLNDRPRDAATVRAVGAAMDAVAGATGVDEAVGAVRAVMPELDADGAMIGSDVEVLTWAVLSGLGEVAASARERALVPDDEEVATLAI